MGYTGSFVICRSLVELGEIEAVEDRDGGLEDLGVLVGDWRIGRNEDDSISDDADGLLRDLVILTGAPALTAHVIDSDTVDLIGRAGSSGRWRACLAREAMSGYASDKSLGLDEEFLPAVDAAERAAGWAREAALQPDVYSLREIFQRDNAELLAEDMFWEFLGYLGFADQEARS